MSLYRFFCPDLAPGAMELPADQGHHARDVLRLLAGARLELFDGRGGHATGPITRVAKHAVVVEIGSVERDAAPVRTVTLATTAPKAERADWLVEQASQLGVTTVQWLACARGIVKPKEGGGKLEKWRRLAVESAKQCGRNYLMTVEPMRSVAEVVAARQPGAARAPAILWLEPGGEPMAAALARIGPAIDFVALIGPEGGWDDGERAFLSAAAGVQRVGLMANILRIETACAAVATVMALSDPAPRGYTASR